MFSLSFVSTVFGNCKSWRCRVDNILETSICFTIWHANILDDNLWPTFVRDTHYSDIIYWILWNMERTENIVMLCKANILLAIKFIDLKFSSPLFQYSFFLTTIFILEFSIGGTAYIYETQVDDELLHTMNGTFINSYGIDAQRTEAIDLMQQNVRILMALPHIWLNFCLIF